MNSRDLIAAIEACYDVERSFVSWLEGVHSAFAPIVDHGLGTCAYRYDLLGPSLTAYEMVEKGCVVDVAGMTRALSTVSADYVAQSWKTLQSGTSSEVPGFDDQYLVKAFFRPAGVGDSIVINALDAQGVGIWVGGFISKKTKLAPRERAALNHLSAHVVAGYRLQRKLSSAPVAVMSPVGKMLHAEGDAKAARDSLAHAARAIDRARGGLRHRDPEGAVARWRGLVSARWSLVDQFETDGKRYLVAKANTATVPTISNLSPRETQVLAHAALGHHVKMIAYELGIAPSTVRVLMGRAVRKLKARSKKAAVDKFVRLKA